MDELKLVSSWRPGGIPGAAVSVTVSQMLVQGCAMEGGTLVEAGPTAAELQRVPDFAIAWIPQDAAEPYKPAEVLALPAYFTPSRGKVATEFKVPISGDRVQWILCGAAFVLRDD